jgi:hypothetical protein
MVASGREERILAAQGDRCANWADAVDRIALPSGDFRRVIKGIEFLRNPGCSAKRMRRPLYFCVSSFEASSANHLVPYRALRRDSLCHFHLHSLLQNRASPRLVRKRVPPLRNGVLQCPQMLNVVPVAIMRAAYSLSADCKSVGRKARTGRLFLSGTK